MSIFLIYLFGAIVVAEYMIIQNGESYRAGALWGLSWPLIATIFLILAPIIGDAD